MGLLPSIARRPPLGHFRPEEAMCGQANAEIWGKGSAWHVACSTPAVMRERKFSPLAYRGQQNEETFAWTALDRATTEAIYRQHAAFVAGFLRRMGLAERHVNDEVPRVFAAAHRQIANTANVATTKAWVAAIALRDVARRHRLAKVALDSAEGSDPEIDEFLMTLDAEPRAIFILFELEGEPSEAIATAFGISVERARERIVACQTEFRHAYGLMDAEPAPSSADEGHGLPVFVDPVSLV